LIINDKKEDGLIRHWWNYYDNPDEVGKSGSVFIKTTEGTIIKEFPADFGAQLRYCFRVQ